MNKLSFAVAACAAMMAMSGAADAHRAPIQYVGDAQSAAASSNDLAGGDPRSYGYGARSQQGAAILDLRRPAEAPAAALAPGEGVGPQAPGLESQAPASPTPASPMPVSQGSEQGRPAWLETERVGPPYQANGRWYVPAAEPGYEATGLASWYGPNFHGGRTASGEIYDQEAITAAHPTLPIPSLVQVTNLENGREVIVRVNDRGPFVGDRILDLSHGAAQVLGVERTGTARVHIRYLGPAPRPFSESAGGQAPSAPSSSPPLQSASAEEGGPASLLPPPASGESPAPGAVQQVAFAPPAPLPVGAANGAYFVQVGAFSDVDNAHRLAAQVAANVASAGQVAVDVRRNGAGAELFRVRIGPFASRDAAEAARRSAAARGYAQSVVVAP